MNKIDKLLKDIKQDEWQLPEAMIINYINEIIAASHSYDREEKLENLITDIYRTGRHHELKEIIEAWKRLYENSSR